MSFGLSRQKKKKKNINQTVTLKKIQGLFKLIIKKKILNLTHNFKLLKKRLTKSSLIFCGVIHNWFFVKSLAKRL